MVPHSPGKPPCLSQVPVSSLDNVYSLPAVALISFHSSMSGTCFTSPVLDLLTCFWPLQLSLCPFTPVSCLPGHHRVLHFCPQCSFSISCMLFLLLKRNYLFFLEKTPPLFMFKILEILPLLSVTVSFLGQCEVSPSPFPAAH